MRILFLCHSLLAITAFSKPLQRHRRHDVDCNGVPDWCYEDGATAHCLRADGTWTTVSETSSIACSDSWLSSRVSTTKSKALITSAKAIITTSATALSTTVVVTSATSVMSVAKLPAPAHFKSEKGLRWKIELQGNIQYSGLKTKTLNGDKCRTGKVGDKVIWNCGDMQCSDDWEICGFAMGPAFYGTDNVMTIDTSNVDVLQYNEFVNPWPGDSIPESPHFAWGMDTSNVAAINSTHGVAFAWEVWRGAADGSHVDRGNAAAIITLGAEKPLADRVGPLLTGPEKIALGLLAILRADDYVYTYSIGDPSDVIVGRVPADDSIFDASKHEFLHYGTNNTWLRRIPASTDSNVGATTANGKFGCSVYGSVFYNTYLEKYTILCSIFMTYVNMYTSDTPYGPWSAAYTITRSGSDGFMVGSYGAMAHPEYGSGKEWYFSIGPNSVFQVFKVTFDY